MSCFFNQHDVLKVSHLVACISTSFLCMAEYYPIVYMVYSMTCLHIHPMMDSSVVSIFWLLGAVLAQTVFKKKVCISKSCISYSIILMQESSLKGKTSNMGKSISYVYFKAISVIGGKIQISKAHTDS